MIVADLQALLEAARQFAAAAEISTTAKNKLASVSESLEPFKSMEILAFGEFLRQADEYRRTGVLPVRPKGARGSARAASPKSSPEARARQVEQLGKQLNDLFAVVHEDTVGFGAIDEICEVIGKLNAPEVKEVAKGFGIKVPSKASKKDSLEQIKRKLTEQKGSAQRIRPIASARPEDENIPRRMALP